MAQAPIILLTKLAILFVPVTLILMGCSSGTSATNTGVPVTSGPPAAGIGTLLLVRGDNLFKVPAAGGQEEQLTHETNSNFANNPAYSPDGSQIAYTHHIAPTGDEWGGAELHVMQADGSGDKTIVPAKAKGERAESPAWTPDGKAIYFAHDIPIIDQSNRYTGDTLSVDKIELASGARQTVVKDAILPSISPAGTFVWVTYDA
ncbi:MAG: PD40 domain-containing protein, partial [Chloroflexi bacterium]|nr:PD40 domain-containing protein [Chloroflexota bacterium]